MKPSKYHGNKKLYNWLVYRIGDRLMNNCRGAAYALLGRVFRKYFVANIHETTVGIKSFNQVVDSKVFDYFVDYFQLGMKLVGPERVFLGIDGLRDQYSLLGQNILDSPHYSLVRQLCHSTEKDYRENIVVTEYYKRFTKGILDFRNPVMLGDGFLEFMFRRNCERLHSIKNGKSLVVKVLQVEDKFFVADGKHTAALYALQGKPIPCVDVTPVVFDSWIYWVYRKISTSKRKNDYSKHLKFFDGVYKGESDAAV